MGSDILDYHMDNSSLLKKYKIKDLTSVFPSTTPVATTSMYTGLSPIEHGWIGWNCYFKEVNQELVLFTNTDFYTHQKSTISNIVNKVIGYETINSKIEKATNNKILTYEIFPAFRKNGVKSISELFEKLKTLCQTNDEKFILAYWDDPDKTMHKVGTKAKEIKDIISNINDMLLNLFSEINDTIIIIAADHGQIDMEDNIFLNKITSITEHLEALPSLGKRVMSFKIKKDHHLIFKINFEKIFKDDFALFSKNEFIQIFLGPGIPHKKIDEFLGDFIAVATGNKMFQYEAFNNKNIQPIAANHAGLTHEEMIVPLIIIEKK